MLIYAARKSKQSQDHVPTSARSGKDHKADSSGLISTLLATLEMGIYILYLHLTYISYIDMNRCNARKSKPCLN